MVITDTDLQLLKVLAQYYVLTREQIQRFSATPINSERSVRRRLLKMGLAELIRKHRIPVALPGKNGAAPVYYLTKNSTEVLADHFNDGTYLGLPTRQPRVDRLNHWVALNETRWTIEQAIAPQSEVGLERWINEWETVNKSAHEKEQFYLQTKLNENPPLSCSPDAGFVMSLRGHKKVFYLEQDLGTSSPKQIAARKTKGYAELANRKLHRKHFPETTLDTFTVLFITTTAYRSQTTAERIRTRPRPDLWLCIDQHELTPESFLHGPITLNYQGERAALVKPIETKKEIPC